MLGGLRYRLRAIFRRADMERELATELQLHHERHVAKLVARGVPPPEASRQARLALGGAERVKEEARDAWGVRALDAVRRDFRGAVRVLRKHPAVTACGILIVAISTGASTAVFTVLDSTVFKPLPVPNADRLVRLTIAANGADARRSAPYAALQQLEGLTHSLQQLAAEGRPTAPTVAASSQQAARTEPASARAMCTTGNYFDALGVHPRIGRTLQPFDDRPEADHGVAVGTYRYWRDRYGLDPSAVGSTVRVRSRPFTLVGFLPEGFQGLRKGLDADVYVPMAALADECLRSWGGDQPVEAIGLLARDTGRDAASEELAQLWKALKQSPAFAPGAIAGDLVVTDASRGIAAINDTQQTSLYLLAAAVAVIVLVGCLNASCLLAVQGVTRRNEIALRRALGATAHMVLRQSLVESCLLTGAGGVCGLALASWGGRAILTWLRRAGPPIELSIDARVLGFSLVLVLVTGIVSGLIPAIDAATTRQLDLHRDEQVRPFRSGKVLICLEVALSLTLLTGAGMFLRGVANLRSVPLGFDARGIVVVTLWPNYDAFPAGVENERYMNAEASRLRERLPQIHGLERATVGTGDTFGGGLTNYAVTRAGLTPGESVTTDAVQHVDDRYFDVMEIPVVAGRAFSDRDTDGGERVVMINRALAERLFGQASPVGQPVTLGTTTATVVGVTGDIRRKTLKAPPASVVYLPLWQRPPAQGWAAQVVIQVKTRQSPAELSAAIESEISSGHYALRASPAPPTTLEAAIGASYADDTLRLKATSLLAGIALALVLVGLYGVTTYGVARRRREIGVRMTIGATPAGILGLIVRESGTFVGIGLLLGIPGALAVMRALSSYTFEVSSLDPAALGGAAAAMVFAAGLAVVPAVWRATHVDPVETLRVP